MHNIDAQNAMKTIKIGTTQCRVWGPQNERRKKDKKNEKERQERKNEKKRKNERERAKESEWRAISCAKLTFQPFY